MSSVLVHIGCTTGPHITTTRPPGWLEHTVKQYFTFNDGDLYILTDRDNIPYLPDGVIPVAIEDYHSEKIDQFNALYEHETQDFWTAAATRFFYLENFMRENDLQNVVHFDNDVLIYFNIAEYLNAFQSLYPGIGVTPESPIKSPAGFMYINDYQSLERMTDFFIEQLERYGEVGLRELYDTDTLTEMTLIVDFKKKYPEFIADLPIVPQDQYADEFEAIFDPLSWGEYVDGTRLGKKIGHHSPGAYIVEWLDKNPNSAVTWKLEEDLWCPYLSCAGELTKINNLHMHSKNLSSFLSVSGPNVAYWTKLYHNYHELTLDERRRYEQNERKGLSLWDRFFFEGCLPIPGEMYRADRQALYDTILQYKPTHCYEIGTGSGGGSTFFLACAFAKLGRGKVISIEINDGPALRNYQQYTPDLLPFVEFLTGDDPSLFDLGERVDCVFLDGAEDGEQTLKQYEFFKPYFRPGSILMAHDWGTEKMRLLRPIIENSPDWDIEIQLGEPESVGFVIARYRG